MHSHETLRRTDWLLQNLIDTTLERSTLPREALGVFGGFATAARVAAIALSLAACGVLAWIIGRLRSQMVRQDFA